MNNLHLQKFQFFRFTENEPNNDIYGNDVWDQDKIFLHLKTNEIYSQYLDLALDEFESIQTFKIYDANGNSLILNTHYFYTIKNFGNKNIVLFGLKKAVENNRDCNTFYLELETNIRNIYSNYFNLIVDEKKLKQTTLVTYWHSENFYNANYFDAEFIPQQIRLPMYFSHSYSEADAEKYQNTYEIENRHRIGRVKRLFMEDWKVILNDSNYIALCTVLDSDNIYFDNVFFSLEPFKPERDSEEKGFTISNIECQRYAEITFDQGTWGDYFNIYSDDIVYYFNYSHNPENTENSGQWFLVNRLYNNYVNDLGIIYDCDLKTIITKIPVKGFLANNLSHHIYSVGDEISYCDKDNLVYFPNGFDNNLGVSGSYSETFKFRIEDQNGNTGKEMTHTINMTDIAVPSIDLSVSILWFDNTSTPKTGSDSEISVKMSSLIFDPADPVISSQWEIFNGADWVFYKNKTTDNEVFTLNFLENKIRLKAVSQFGDVAYSNILIYTKTATANIYITDKVLDINSGFCTYKLHVENEIFSGFANMTGRRSSQTRNARINDDFGGVLIIPNGTTGNPWIDFYSSTPVTIPVGVYDCILQINAVPVGLGTVEVDAGISYGFTEDYHDGITHTEAHLLTDPI